MKFIDTHCHVTLENFDEDREDLLKIMEEELEFFIEVAIDMKSSEYLYQYSKNFKNGFITVGVHPTETENFNYDSIEQLKLFLPCEKVIAIGEIGLDFHWDTDRNKQYKALEMQLELAKNYDIPVIFHVRDAYKEMYDFLNKSKFSDLKGVVHCFSGNYEIAKKFLDLGYYLGFDGPITYPKNEELRETIRNIPIDRILFETDSPFLPPKPFRGKRNDPLKVSYVYEKAADVLNINIEELKSIVFQNAKKLFDI
ncbi:TatD family hydrolase [Oceanotoga sp.]|uniref:TatD family hydrolase n=1 Tax=Oceanotoga sp. TaxID=2108366 RepID=UPI002805815A|nr:TatD family hydrolase [Oceanotoga sp.]